METKKRLFRNSVANYGLDNNYYLCYKYTKEEKKLELSNRRGDNRHIKKNMENMNFSIFILYQMF